mmetsp:Transcript_56815/g.101354  ORF Transcript_56815/g.101354 Transcript_56815/m.101354 type:complete len:316 (-) Transcript_56815:2989-3936(-)
MQMVLEVDIHHGVRVTVFGDVHQGGRQHGIGLAVPLHVHVHVVVPGTSVQGVRRVAVGVEPGLPPHGEAPRHVGAGRAEARGVRVACPARQVRQQLEVPPVAETDLDRRVGVLEGPLVSDPGPDPFEGPAQGHLGRRVVRLQGGEVDVAVRGHVRVEVERGQGEEGIGEEHAAGGALALVQLERVLATIESVQQVVDPDDVPDRPVQEQRRLVHERVVDAERGAQVPPRVGVAVAVQAEHSLGERLAGVHGQRAVGARLAVDLVDGVGDGVGDVAVSALPEGDLLEDFKAELGQAAGHGERRLPAYGGLLQIREV